MIYSASFTLTFLLTLVVRTQLYVKYFEYKNSKKDGTFTFYEYVIYNLYNGNVQLEEKETFFSFYNNHLQKMHNLSKKPKLVEVM